MGDEPLSKLVETVVAICLTHTKNEKRNITQNNQKNFQNLPQQTWHSPLSTLLMNSAPVPARL